MLKHWRAFLGLLFFVKPVWEGIKWLLDWFGRFDIITSYLHGFGVQAMLDFLSNPPAWTVWPTIAFGCLLIWWDVKRKEVSALSFEQQLLIGFYAGCTAMAIGIWSAWWIVSTPAKEVPKPITPAPAVTPKPPTPPPPPPLWVSEEEISRQQTLGRTLLRYSPQELFQMYEGNQDLSVIVNKWIVVRGPTTSVPVSETVKNREYYKVAVKLQQLLWNQGEVVASFDSKKWGDALIKIKPGENVRAICQFSNVTRKQLNPTYQIFFDTIVTSNCEAF